MLTQRSPDVALRFGGVSYTTGPSIPSRFYRQVLPIRCRPSCSTSWLSFASTSTLSRPLTKIISARAGWKIDLGSQRSQKLRPGEIKCSAQRTNKPLLSNLRSTTAIISSVATVTSHISSTVTSYIAALARSYFRTMVAGACSAAVMIRGSPTSEGYGYAMVVPRGSPTSEDCGCAMVEPRGSPTSEGCGCTMVVHLGSAVVRSTEVELWSTDCSLHDVSELRLYHGCAPWSGCG
jgi:hypothetical protein